VDQAALVARRKDQVAKVEEIGHQFEISRARMEQVLTPFISERVAKKLLMWGLDRVQRNHPILRNVHWSPSGDLVDNGTIEVNRFVKNAEALPADQDPVAAAKAALLELVTVRLSAVEQGLGPSMKQAVEREVTRLREILK